MKFSIISPFFLPLPGGISIDVYYRCRVLIELGHEVQLFIPNLHASSAWKELYELAELGVQVNPVPLEFLDMLRQLQTNPASDKGISKIELDWSSETIPVKKAQAVVARGIINNAMASFNPDVIHVDCPEIMYLSIGFIPSEGVAKAWREKAIALNHGSLVELQKRNDRIENAKFSQSLEKYIYHSYRLSVFPSDFIREKLDLDNSVTIRYLGADKSLYRFIDRSRRPNNKTVLYVGRMSRDKNVKFVVEAAREAVDMDDVTWLMVGGGPFLRELKKLKSNNIRFIGRVPFRELPEWYAKADVFVNACDYEAIGLSVGEAMCTGLPVVVPDVGGSQEHFESGVSGFTYKNRNIESFLETIRRLLNDDQLRYNAGLKASEVAGDWLECTRALVDEVKGHL